MNAARSKALHENLKRLAVTHAAFVEMLNQSIEFIEEELAEIDGDREAVPRNSGRVYVDHETLCVVQGRRRCFLGNTMPLKLIERLLKWPDQYVSYDRLMHDVWHGLRDRSSIRSVVRDLRSKLRSAGMAGLASVIDGHSAGHYRIMLRHLKSLPTENPQLPDAHSHSLLSE